MTKPRFESADLPPPPKSKLEAAFTWDPEAKKLLKRSTGKEVGTWQNNALKNRVIVCFEGVVYFRETLLEIMGVPHEPYVPLKSGPKPGRGYVSRGPRSEYKRKGKPASERQVMARVNSIFNMGQS